MIDILISIMLLLLVGFIGGGSIALFASPSTLTDDQYREIRFNMKNRRRVK